MPYLHPDFITPRRPESQWATRKMMQVLTKQGQIEPLQVTTRTTEADKFNIIYETFEQDAWGDDIVYAARALGWETIFISIMDKYEG